tara:strand:- start:249 stop:488 length:240 start_codon:yes stop_codon:yes gene_type:complete
MDTEIELKIDACKAYLEAGIDWENLKDLTKIHNILCDIVETGNIYVSEVDANLKLQRKLVDYEDIIRKVRMMIMKQIKS